MPEGLSKQKCVPCSVSIPPMKKEKAEELLKGLDGWELAEGAKKILKNYRFRDFAEAMEFVNKVGEICEVQGHHSDIFVSYSRVAITNYTHKIGGLHRNDFVLAAKIDGINFHKPLKI